MKYIPMQTGMWAVFAASFRKNLTAIFGLDGKTARTVTANAKQTYAQILKELPDFEKGDRFLMNIVSCAMLAAFVLSMPERPDVTRLTSYYEQSMMTPAMRFYCRKSGSSREPFSHGKNCAVSRRGPEPVFLEHGLSPLCRRLRL